MKVVINRRVGFTRAQIMDSAVFGRWAYSVGRDAWKGTITIVDVDAYNGQIHSLMVRLQRRGVPWATRAILRSATVDVQVQITDGQSEPYVIFVSQWRDTVGQVVLSNPAGGIDWGESPNVAALREVEEETHLPRTILLQSKLRQLVSRPVIVSPGVTNELTYLYALEVTVTPGWLKGFLAHIEDRVTGLAEEGERISLQAIPRSLARTNVIFYEPDAKTLLSLSLNGL